LEEALYNFLNWALFDLTDGKSISHRYLFIYTEFCLLQGGYTWKKRIFLKKILTVKKILS
jgi:hypothetical protein